MTEADDPKPDETEFPSAEEAAAYNAWFRAKVEKALSSTEPRIPHDQVMAEVRMILAKYRDA